MDFYFRLIITALCVIPLLTMLVSGNFFKNLISSSVKGITALLVINLIAFVSNVGLPYNLFTVITACLYGIPGCIFLMILKLLF